MWKLGDGKDQGKVVTVNSGEGEHQKLVRVRIVALSFVSRIPLTDRVRTFCVLYVTRQWTAFMRLLPLCRYSRFPNGCRREQT